MLLNLYGSVSFPLFHWNPSFSQQVYFLLLCVCYVWCNWVYLRFPAGVWVGGYLWEHGSLTCYYTARETDFLFSFLHDSQYSLRQGWKLMSSFFDRIWMDSILFSLARITRAAVSSWVQWAGNNQKTLFSNTPFQPLALAFSQLWLSWCFLGLLHGRDVPLRDQA